MSTVRSQLSSRFAHAQRGAALVTSLLLLLILTIIGVTAMQMTRMQERMSGNARDLNLAFQGAEAAVRDGEALIRVQPGTPDNCTALPCEFWQANLALMTNPETRDWITWWRVYGNEYEDAGGDHDAPIRDMPQLAEDPRFVVQYITRVPDSLTIGEGGGAPPGRDFYLVTARSLGGVPAPTAAGQPNPAVAVLQSTFARR
jgi:type IV pilus assembly protein PilX